MLHLVEAFAGTGKSVLGRAVVLSFVTNGPPDQILAYVTASRDLRDDVVLSITELSGDDLRQQPHVET